MIGQGNMCRMSRKASATLKICPKPSWCGAVGTTPVGIARCCGKRAPRRSLGRRTLHDLGDVLASRPIDLVVTYSKHKCPHCNLRFAADMADLAVPKCQYTKRVQDLAESAGG